MRTAITSLFFALIASTCALAQETPPRTITTSGEALVYVEPDEVVVSLGVETADAGLSKAVADNDELSARLLKAIRDLGVNEANIQAEDLTVEIRYVTGWKPVVEGYIARRAYMVKLVRAKKLEKLVETALKNGCNRLMGFEYRTTELRKHRDQARKMSIRAAREKAVALAGELQCTVGAPRTINEQQGYWGYYSSRWGGGHNWMSQNVAQVAPGGPDGGESDTMPVGRIAVRAQVSVTFDLTPAR